MKPFGILVVFAALLLSLWSYWASHVQDIASWWLNLATRTDIGGAGQWGDSFGAFNALVSALGFAAVLATLWLQSVALKDQARDLHRQRFEGTFFELMRLMRELRSELTFAHSDAYKNERESSSSNRFAIIALSRPLIGVSAVAAAVSEIRFWTAPARSKSTSRQQLAELYRLHIHKNNEASFGPYFRIIYTILNRIREDSVLSDSEKASYGNLLRSQLTSEEVTLLAVNALAPVAKDLEKLIVYFRILKYLPNSSMQRRLSRIYDATAFQSRD